ncbi:MFS transporter [Aquiflexum sp.]|uniref:MFS transporter n=1 Tax=Aquiflexum sp. TaxID=1872584 RepID=UPI00359366D6
MVIFSAFRYKNYRLYFWGQAFSNLGTMIKQVAIGWLVFRLTDSALLLGLVTFSREISAFLISSIAGVVADRYNKHKLLIISHSLLAANSFLLAALTLGDQITVGWMIGIQILFGCISGIEMPSRQSLVNDLVEDKTYLTNAIALNSSLFNTARIAGPSIAGILIPFVGEGVCFLLYGIMSLMVVVCFRLIQYEGYVRKTYKLNFKVEFMDGFNYAYQSPPIKLILVFVAFITMLGVSYIVILPVFAGRVFNAGAEVFGYLTSAIGLGSVLGALLVGNKSNLEGLDKYILFGGIIFGVGVMAFAVSDVLWFSLLTLVMSGFGRVMIFTGSNTLLQTIAPDDKRGRVLSLYIMLFMGALSIGSFLIGLLTEWFGAPNVLMGGGFGVLVCTLIYAFKMDVFREVNIRFQQEVN